MTDSIWPVIHAERQALADDLAQATAEHWATPSLCSEWTVHQVLAHLVSAARMTPVRFVRRFAAAGFRFNEFTGRQVSIEGAGGPAATLAAFRAVQHRRSAPPGPGDTWLGEAFVHGEDIRRPLGIARAYPLSFVTRTIAFYAGSNVIIGGKARVAGVTLQATDADFSVGTGPPVQGPAVSLLLAAAGRRSALAELTGPGVPILAGRG